MEEINQELEVKMKVCSKCKEEHPTTKEYFNGDKTRPDGLCYVCKKCKSPEKKKYRNIPDEHKRCRQCKNVLPLNKFNINKGNFDGKMNVCIECQLNNRGREYNNTDKTCKKCNRNFPLTQDYFLKDKLCLDGFRNICKECVGGKFGHRNNNLWSKEEDTLLIQHYPFMSNEDLVKMFLPNRKISNITDHATKILKLHKDEEYLKYKDWSKEQVLILEENYKTMDNKELALIIGKNEPCIIAKAIGLGIKKDSWWTDEEEKILIDKYSHMKTEDLTNEYFPDRGFNSVIAKVQKLGLSKDDDYLYKIRVETGIKNLELIPDQKGENSPRWVERVEIICDQCGGDIELTPYNTQNQEHYFCSRECMGKWRSENLCGENSPVYGRADEIWTPAMRLKAAENAVIRLKELNFSKKPTKPQLITNNLLDDMCVNYENEYDCKYYLVDNYLTDYNLMIEVMGNFFHCSPVMNLENSRKTKIIGKDKAKHTYIKKYKSIEVLYLWEKDIHENIDVCRSLVEKYIKNNGILENYHSYNYYLNDGKLELIDNLYVIGY